MKTSSEFAELIARAKPIIQPLVIAFKLETDGINQGGHKRVLAGRLNHAWYFKYTGFTNSGGKDYLWVFVLEKAEKAAEEVASAESTGSRTTYNTDKEYNDLEDLLGVAEKVLADGGGKE